MLPAGLSELVQRCEGFSPRPYLCPAGYWTIGFGEVCGSPETPHQTRQEALQRLENLLLPKYVAEALRLSPRLSASGDDRLTAVADFVYNLGAARYAGSTFRRKVNAGDWDAAADECRKWVWGGGKKLPGLVLRRAIEANLLIHRG